jgi:dinuclear metal center YbgI/SA1388 family protein
MSNHMSVVGCHTNLDVARGGVNDALASAIGLTHISPLTLKDAPQRGSTAAGEEDTQESLLSYGFGRIGQMEPAMNGDAFLQHLFDALSISSLAVAGRLPATIATVAVCGGSGSDLAEKAYLKGADVYLTGEVKHSTARWAEASNFCVIDAGHFATENPVVETLADILQTVLTENGRSLEILTAVNQKDPFVFYNR